MISIVCLLVALVAFLLAVFVASGTYSTAIAVGLAAIAAALLVERIVAGGVVRRVAR